MKKIIVLISALVLLGLLAVLVLLQPSQLEPEEQTSEETTTEETTEETQNPIEGEIPDVNPTENTNPFSETYKNPFE